MAGWQLWDRGEVLKEAAIEPRLASWEAKDHPAQLAQQRYLSNLAAEFGPLVAGRERLFLHMDLDVLLTERLLHHYDLENYLTPVVDKLGATHFVFASARKYVGGGSRLIVGEAAPGEQGADLPGWSHFACSAGSGSSKPAWKASLREVLAATRPQLLPSGPVDVRLAWRCSPPPKRNWVWLWKPTGDAMGPVLGEPGAKHPFNPSDDRIVSLGLHLNADESMGHDVDVGMWWRPATARA